MNKAWLYSLPLVGCLALLAFLGFALGQAVISTGSGTDAVFVSGVSGVSGGAVEAALLPLLESELAYAEAWGDLNPAPEPLTPAAWSGEARYVLVNFFASWCAPCLAEHKQLMGLKEALPIYGVLWRDRAEAAVAWLQREGLPYQKVGASNDQISQALKITGVPTSFLLDLGEATGTTSGVRICWRGDAPLLGGDDLTWQDFLVAYKTCTGGTELSVPEGFVK